MPYAPNLHPATISTHRFQCGCTLYATFGRLYFESSLYRIISFHLYRNLSSSAYINTYNTKYTHFNTIDTRNLEGNACLPWHSFLLVTSTGTNKKIGAKKCRTHLPFIVTCPPYHTHDHTAQGKHIDIVCN